MKPNLLIIEDEKNLAKQLKWGLTDTYEIMIVHQVEKAKKFLQSGAFPVATLDLGLPPSPDTPEEGFRLLEAMPGIAPHTRIIVITGNAEQENAIKAIDLGAVDFCAKPINIEMLKVILARAYKIYDLEQANLKLHKEQGECYSLCNMLGVAPSMGELFQMIRQVSNTDYPVLIQGESGTGKEMVARAIHQLSNRSTKPLIILNCGAIPQNLLESELFGHEKGAFTGAIQKKIGKFEQADGGILFLDEIGDMPLELQVKLLRFLQEGTIERVGGSKTFQLDVRILAATHVDLDAAVKNGKFREDMFFRLNVVSLDIPPLRERQEDILLLARHFIAQETQKLGRKKIKLSQTGAAALTAHSWPGNIRELQNCIFRALAISADNILTPKDLGLVSSEICDDNTPIMTIKEAREAAEKQAVIQALSATGGNISQASKLLDVSRPTLHDLIKRHGIER